jgi:nucleotide-binding universal stress UspA family protein
VLVASGPVQPINRVLAAYDGTDVASRAAVFARDLARGMGWPLTILALPRAKFTLDQALQWAQTIAPEAQVIAEAEGGGEAAVIERVVHKDPHALLVMGAYADSWFKDLFTGSTTSHVLTHLKSPIILVHGR